MRCPACDTPNPPEAVRCEECGAKMPVKKRPPAPVEEDEEESPQPPRSKSAERSDVRPRRPRPEEIDEEEDEEEEERPRRRRRIRRYDEDDDDEDEEAGIETIIPFRNPKALACYYMSFFALLPALGIILAIISIVLGIMGIKEQQRNRRAKGTAHAVFGVILSTISLIANPLICFVLYKIYF